MNRIFEKKNIISIFAFIMLIIIGLTLFVFKLGVADNGTLFPQLKETGIYDVKNATGSGYYSDTYAVADTKLTFHTYSLFYELFKFVGKDGIIYSYFPALLYAVIFIASAVLLMLCIMDKNKTAKTVLLLLFILMFCDSGYITLFNTPYKEGAFIVYLLATLSALVFADKTKKVWAYILFGIMGILLGNVSFTGAMCGIGFGIYAIVKTFKADKVLRKIILGLSAILMLVVSIYTIATYEANLHDSVYFGVAVQNPYAENMTAIPEENAKEILESFDGSNSKMVGIPYSSLSLVYKPDVKIVDVVKYYITNPTEFLEKMEIVARNATTIKTGYLGNYLSSTGKMGVQTNFFSLYSSIKRAVIPARYILLTIIMAVLLCISYMYKSKYAKEDKTLCSIGMLMAVLTVVTMPVPLILNGFAQLSFNMLSYNFMFDVSLFLLVVTAVKFFSAKRQILKEKYGVNQ